MPTYRRQYDDTEDRIEHHLRTALDATTHEETLYHVRQAAQLRLIEGGADESGLDTDAVLLAN